MVVVHVGKWMKGQNVVTAGHCWEQCLLKGAGQCLKTLILLRLWTECFRVIISHRQYRHNCMDEKMCNPTHSYTDVFFFF